MAPMVEGEVKRKRFRLHIEMKSFFICSPHYSVLTNHCRWQWRRSAKITCIFTTTKDSAQLSSSQKNRELMSKNYTKKLDAFQHQILGKLYVAPSKGFSERQ